MKTLAEKLTQKIKNFDGVKVKTAGQKTSFIHHSEFASLAPQKNKLILNFITPSKINHTRMKTVKKIKANKFSHTLVTKKNDDTDPQVSGWLMIAHATN